jgi:Uma2 family endonuclease
MESTVWIPETKPAYELIDGRLVQKMSPKQRHQELEFRWVTKLRSWVDESGNALAEWRVNFRAPGRRWGSLVPDVAYFSGESLSKLSPEQREEPPIAPDAVVEILSAGDAANDLDWKVGAYLAAGTKVVFIVDPPAQTVIAHDPRGVTSFAAAEVLVHSALPGFSYALDEMFKGLYLG